MAKKKLDMTIPTVVFVTLTLGALGTALHYSAEDARLQVRAEDAQKDLDEIESATNLLREESKRLRYILTGRDREGAPFISSDEGEWRKTFKDQVDNVPGFQAILNDERLPPNVVALLGKDPYDGKTFNFGPYHNLRQMNRLLTVEAAHMLFQVKQSDLEVQAVEDWREKLETQRVEIQKRLKSLREEIEDQADSWTTRLVDETGILDDRISDLNKAIEAKKREIRRTERDNERNKSRLETALSIKEDSIKILIERELITMADTEPAAVIDHADMVLGKVWINLGSRHGLRRGQRFEVFQFVKGGRRQIKGLVEVQKMDDSQAQCIILPNSEMRDYETGIWHTLPAEFQPIIKGDLVRTPFFEVNRQPVFVFVGENFKNPLYRHATDSEERLERMIRRQGGLVDDRVTARTDFVITRQKPENDEGYQSAVQFGITFIDEDDIYKFIEP